MTSRRYDPVPETAALTRPAAGAPPTQSLRTWAANNKKGLLALAVMLATTGLYVIGTKKSQSNDSTDVLGVKYFQRLGLDPSYEFDDACDPITSGEWTVTSGSFVDSEKAYVQDDDDGKECEIMSQAPGGGELYLTSTGGAWSQTMLRTLINIPCTEPGTINSKIYTRVPWSWPDTPDPSKGYTCSVSMNPTTYATTMELQHEGQDLAKYNHPLGAGVIDMCHPFTVEMTVGGNDDFLYCALSQTKLGVSESIGSVEVSLNGEDAGEVGGIGFATDHAHVSLIDLEVLGQTPTSAPTPRPTAEPSLMPSVKPTLVPSPLPTSPAPTTTCHGYIDFVEQNCLADPAIAELCGGVVPAPPVPAPNPAPPTASSSSSPSPTAPCPNMPPPVTSIVYKTHPWVVIFIWFLVGLIFCLFSYICCAVVALRRELHFNLNGSTAPGPRVVPREASPTHRPVYSPGVPTSI